MDFQLTFSHDSCDGSVVVVLFFVVGALKFNEELGGGVMQ
jgi:hypothetical protein